MRYTSGLRQFKTILKRLDRCKTIVACNVHKARSPLNADLHKLFYSLYSFYYFILTHAPHPPPSIPSSSSKFPRFLLSKMEVPRIQPFHPQKPINTTSRRSISQRRKPQKPTQH